MGKSSFLQEFKAFAMKVWAILIRCPVRSLWDYHLVSKL